MNAKLKVLQLLPTLAFGDGVGLDTLALDKIIKEMGYETKIYAENIDSRIDKRIVSSINSLPKLKKTDVLIYHLSTGTELNNQLSQMNCRKIIVYHNITPPEFFEKYNYLSYELCKNGRNQMAALSKVPDYCLADSEYNKRELQENGYRCKIDVLPIIVPFEDYEKTPNRAIVQKYSDGWENIVFVGRIAPNKKQEDIIKTFYYYKKYINQKSRLFLVGSYKGMERYHARLCKYVEELELEDVYFTGHTKFDEILAYYKVATVFVSMSEHEGFCIPLVEAMYFGVPIIAFSDTGVKETLAGSGLKMNTKDCKVAAELIEKLRTDKNLRDKVVASQNERLQDFGYERVKQQFESYLRGYIG